MGETITLLHGTLPRERIRIELTAYPSGAAVPFARVKRGSPQGIEFFINPAQPLDEFIGDWTAYHELSHLFIPFPGIDDIWFSEGLASYYQNVLQYRTGLLTEEQAWQKLHDGFERGRNDDGDSELTLAELSPLMRKKHSFMRVYWSGALYFLEADLALRADSGAGMSLDTVLREFGACCLERRRDWDGASIAAEFDRIAGTAIFVPLFDRYEGLAAIPDYGPVLESAGIAVSDGRVVVQQPGFLGQRTRGEMPPPGAETRITPYDDGLRNHSENELSYWSNKPVENITEYP